MSREIKIAENIVALRKKHNVTQEQLAEAINVSPKTVAKWELSISYPNASKLSLIADFFHVSLEYLFYGCESSNNRKIRVKAPIEYPN